MTPLIDGVDLVKRYASNGSREEVLVLDGANLAVQRGESVAVMGASGSGKSTLLHLLGGLDRPTSGDVRFDGSSIGAYTAEQLALYRNRRIGFIFQFHHLLPEFTALENILMPTLIRGGDPAETGSRAKALMERLQIAHRSEHRPSECSGGEQQRIAIARALINRPDLVLADEPTGNLDQANAAVVLDLLLDVRAAEGLTMILVTHDPMIAARCGRSVRLRGGRMMETQSE
jgi:lipoprotein-releasing system ATP-binding protein